MEPYDLDGATGIELELTLQEDPYDQTFAYGINHVPSWKAKPILASLGETQVWTGTATESELRHGRGLRDHVVAADPARRAWRGQALTRQRRSLNDTSDASR